MENDPDTKPYAADPGTVLAEQIIALETRFRPVAWKLARKNAPHQDSDSIVPFGQRRGGASNCRDVHL
jgi:hypothetical protein